MLRAGLWGMMLSLIALGLPLEAAEQTRHASRATYETLVKINNLMDQDRYRDAQKELDSLLQQVMKSPYEMALVNQSYGYVAIGLNDYPQAIGRFQEAIASGQLPEEVSHRLRFTTAQLLLQEQRPKEALNQLKRWFGHEAKPSPEARVLLAQIHYALKQWKPAIREMKQALREASTPQESWYQFLVGLHLESDQPRPAAELLQRMLRLFPRNQLYWRQLAGVLLQAGREREAVAVLALAAEKDLLEVADLLRLARLYLHRQMPLDGAQLLSRLMADGSLEQSAANLDLLADAWMLAREPQRALKVLDELAKVDRSGRAQLRSGALLFELERWPEAAAALQQGLRLSGRTRQGDWLLLGVASVRANDLATAAKAFAKSLELAVTKSEREQAQRWLDYLQASG